MAPKKKEKNLKRNNIITLKLTDIELAVLNEAADVTGLSRSEYVRKLLLEKQIHHQIEVVADMNDLRKLVSEYFQSFPVSQLFYLLLQGRIKEVHYAPCGTFHSSYR